MLTQKLACPTESAGVAKPGPAGPVLNAPRFGNQVMSKMLHKCIYIVRVCKGKRCSAEAEGHTLWKAAI